MHDYRMPKETRKPAERETPEVLALVGFDEWLEGIYGFQHKEWLKAQQEQVPILHRQGAKHHFGNDITASRRPRSVTFQIGRRVTDNALIAFLNWLVSLVVWGSARVFRKSRARWERLKDIKSIHDLRQDILRHIDRAHYRIVW